MSNTKTYVIGTGIGGFHLTEKAANYLDYRYLKSCEFLDITQCFDRFAKRIKTGELGDSHVGMFRCPATTYYNALKSGKVCLGEPSSREPLVEPLVSLAGDFAEFDSYNDGYALRPVEVPADLPVLIVPDPEYGMEGLEPLHRFIHTPDDLELRVKYLVRKFFEENPDIKTCTRKKYNGLEFTIRDGHGIVRAVPGKVVKGNAEMFALLRRNLFCRDRAEWEFQYIADEERSAAVGRFCRFLITKKDIDRFVRMVGYARK